MHPSFKITLFVTVFVLRCVNSCTSVYTNLYWRRKGRRLSRRSSGAKEEKQDQWGEDGCRNQLKPDVTCQGARSLILPLWQVAKNNGGSSKYFCDHFTLQFSFFIRPKCFNSRALYFFASTFTFIFNLFYCNQFLSVSHLYAPEEEAIASKACAKYISLVQIIACLTDSRKRRKTIIISVRINTLKTENFNVFQNILESQQRSKAS